MWMIIYGHMPVRPGPYGHLREPSYSFCVNLYRFETYRDTYYSNIYYTDFTYGNYTYYAYINYIPTYIYIYIYVCHPLAYMPRFF